jgi:hypothetical protein
MIFDQIVGAASVGLLTGIFYRMGMFTAALEGIENRLKRLENAGENSND